MSKTQKNLHNYICLLIAGNLNFACSDKEEPEETCTDCFESSVCIFEQGECPSMEDFQEENLPIMGCDGVEHVVVTSEAKTSDGGSLSISDDTGTNSGTSVQCCYDTLAQNMGPYTCDYVEGRPLMCEGFAQVASIGMGMSWVEGTVADSHQLTMEQRQILSTFWLRTAQMEHASVASFHQFALDLMRFGANPELLMRTNKAIMDEISHAKAAFAITEGFLGHPFSPQDFAMKLEQVDNLADFAIKVAVEGAFNETLAVVIASFQKEQCTDYAIQKFLTDIIREEAEHAELAWDTLRWLIDKGGDVVVDALWTLLERDFIPDVQNIPLVGIPSHGLPSKNQAFSLLQNAYQHVVLPNLKLILEEKMVQLAV
jgi:hypothetical protein